MSEETAFGFSTLAIHAGAPSRSNDRRPLHHRFIKRRHNQFESTEQAANRFALKEFGNLYTRLTNPTTAVLDLERFAALGRWLCGCCCCVLVTRAQFVTFHSLMGPGDNIVGSQQTLWRYIQPVKPHLQKLRLACQVV